MDRRHRDHIGRIEPGIKSASWECDDDVVDQDEPADRSLAARTIARDSSRVELVMLIS